MQPITIETENVVVLEENKYLITACLERRLLAKSVNLLTLSAGFTRV